jgi:hypothetical protein
VTSARGTPSKAEFELDFERRKLSSPINEVEAFYDRVLNIVLISGELENESTLAAIARELAACLNPQIDPCLLLPAIMLLIDPTSSNSRVSATLDLLGYDRPGVVSVVQGEEEEEETGVEPDEGPHETISEEEVQPKPKGKPRPWTLVSRPLPEEPTAIRMKEADKERRKTTHDMAIARAERYETELGWQPQNVEPEDCGYDLISFPRDGDEPVYIEVKGVVQRLGPS